MNVNQLRDRILDLCHGEPNPDTALQQKALGWLNSAYRQLIDEISPYSPRYLTGEMTVDITNGGAVLPSDVGRISCVSRTNGTVLLPLTHLDVLRSYPTPYVGYAAHYAVLGNQLKLYPQETTTVRILYSRIPADLNDDTQEAALLLPKPYHEALIWGGLVWASTFERGLNSQAEILLFQRKWDEARQNIKLSCLAETAALRVGTFHLV